MTVPTPNIACPIASTPLATCHAATSDISCPHIALCLRQANGTSTSSSTPLLSHPTATSFRFHDASHKPHLCIAPRSVRSRSPLAPSPTLPTSHSNVDISITATSSRSHVASHVSHSHVESPSVQAQSTSSLSSLSSTLHPSHSSTHTSSPPSFPPRRKRSRRCFVCGGTGKHRLNPRFCPRTYELLSKHLAMFDTTFRLVSFDGSPLPMTRHPGGVAAHLLSPRRPPPRTLRVAPRSVAKSPGTSQSNPPHVPHAPHDPPKCVPHHVPHAVPIADLNPSCAPCPPESCSVPDAGPIAGFNRSHAPPAAIVHLRHIPSPEPTFESNPPHASHSSVVRPDPIPVSDRSVESNLPHFPPVERLPSPPIYLPIRIPQPNSKPIADPPEDDSSPHVTLSIFEILFISPSVRTELRELIDALDRGKVGYEWPSTPALRKVFHRILDKIVDSLSSSP